jgi:hypothetical protein
MYKEGALPTPEFVPEMERTPVELNPQTGPVYIKGVSAGDVICVNIEKVTPSARGFTCVVPAVGPLARNVDWPLFLEPRVFHFEHHSGPKRHYTRRRTDRAERQAAPSAAPVHGHNRCGP